MVENAAPVVRPANSHFSSGPCSKRPNWSLAALQDAALGRSHRSKLGKNKLKQAIDLTREVLEVPADYRIGIVPASDTGAVEMALWSLLGARGVDMVAWESFGSGWVSDVVKELKLADVRKFTADYGKLPTFPPSISTATWSSPGTARPRACASPMAISFGRPSGPDDLRRNLGGFRAEPRFHKLDVVTFSGRKCWAARARMA